MKCTEEQIAYMSDKINEVFDRHTQNEILDYRQKVKFVDNQFVAFCWGVFHAAKINPRKFYNAGLNDSHIETALKYILADYK